MASSKNVKIYKTMKVKNPRTGKVEKVKVNVGTKSTNVVRGGNTTLTGNKSKLQSQKIAEAGAIARTNAVQKTARVIGVANEIGSTIRSSFNAGTRHTTNVVQKDPGVSQAINGGLQQGDNRRDDDEDTNNSSWVVS